MMPRRKRTPKGTTMWNPTKSHGLRNKQRKKGVSTYSRMQKGKIADYYGTWNNGVRNG